MPEEGMSIVQAMTEARRCLMCADAPCACNCPAGVDARLFIRKIRFENMAGAVRSLRRANVLAGSCARICPTGSLCGKGCLAAGLSRPIDIGGLQRFVMDWERERGMIEPAVPSVDGARVAVVGSGPAGLGCAAELAVRGHRVTVFERDETLGGMLRQCIPSWRLPTEVVDFDIEFIRKLGVEFLPGQTMDENKKFFAGGFNAVFLATGLTRTRGGDLIGAKTPGVMQALEVLRASKLGEPLDFGKRAIVIGGGDTALDAARTARRSGAECVILYRRTQREMPAYPNEVDEAWNEGVEFYFRVIPRAVVGEERVKGVRCVRIRWHKPMPGMPPAYDVEGSEFVVSCDSVIVATGQGPESTFGLRTSENGLIAVDKESMMTSEPGVFAGGDLVFGGGTAARAVGMGKLAAIRIDDYLRQGAGRKA
ncbi:MAG TPA: FAD-dependent oxidoreductase [bacterium]|nr:FAD-dependent oxidoreductase [bacterium]